MVLVRKRTIIRSSKSSTLTKKGTGRNPGSNIFQVWIWTLAPDSLRLQVEKHPSSWVVFWIWRCVDILLTDVSEEHIASMFRVGKSTSEELAWARGCSLGYVPPKRLFTQYLHGVTSQKTAFFIVTAVNTSNLTSFFMFDLRAFGPVISCDSKLI
jgi:hypothetical protein